MKLTEEEQKWFEKESKKLTEAELRYINLSNEEKKAHREKWANMMNKMGN
ncbi:MAG: hypothetical protein PHC34_01525 [Candidatus Gastranaerophilales bacterium]|nr:hypothetical protein [Candidatus Gastranaerophilales bacterium]